MYSGTFPSSNSSVFEVQNFGGDDAMDVLLFGESLDDGEGYDEKPQRGSLPFGLSQGLGVRIDSGKGKDTTKSPIPEASVSTEPSL
jgi:hypothetical protein